MRGWGGGWCRKLIAKTIKMLQEDVMQVTEELSAQFAEKELLLTHRHVTTDAEAECALCRLPVQVRTASKPNVPSLVTT